MREMYKLTWLLPLLAACAADPDAVPPSIASEFDVSDEDSQSLLDLISRTQPLAVDPMECGPNDTLCAFSDTQQGSCFVAGTKGRFLREVAQTFVAPTSGVLTHVRLNVRKLERDPAGAFPAIHVAVRELRDGVVPPLDETTFAQGLVPLDTLSDGHEEVGVSLAYGDLPTHLVQGREYALVITAQDGMVGIGCNGDDTYDGGQAALRQSRRIADGLYSAAPFVDDKRDLAFAAEIVPEPTAPRAVVTPATLAFGELQKGDSRTLDVTVHNDGDLALALSQVGLTGDTRFALLGSSFVPTLRGHSSATFSIRFDATGDLLGPASATLRMSTNDPETPSVTVPLDALMTDPAAGVTPPAIDFGAVALADAANPPVAHVNVTNTGFGSFQITAVRLTDDTSPNFVLTTPSLPIEVAAASSARIELSFVPQGLGERAGTLEIETSDRDVPLLTVPLAGRSGLPANLAPLPSTIDVGPVQEGLSDERTFVIRNWGDEPLTVSSIAIESTGVPGFSLEPTSIGTLGSGEAQTVTVRYAPPVGSIGPASGTLSIETDDQDTPLVTIAVSATATNPLPTISISDIAFGYLPFEAPPSDASIVVKNEGYGPLTLHAVTLVDGGADFSIQSMPTLPAVLQDGQQVTVIVRFDSNAPVGARSDRVRFITNDREIPELETTLSGLAGAAPTLAVSPSSLTFDEVQGGKSKSLDLTLTNAGQYPLDVTNLRLSSGSASAYSFSPDTLQPVQPGQGRTLTVTLAPTAGDTGQKSGQLQFTTNDPLRQSVSVSLSGTSTNPIPTLSAAPVFPVTSITGPPSTSTVTLSNTGVGTLNVSAVRLAAGSDPAFSIAVSPSVPRALTTGNVAIAITFAPTVTVGPRTAVLEVETDDHETPLRTLALSAVAGVPNIQTSHSSLAFGEVASQTSKSLDVIVTNGGDAPLNIASIAVVGASSPYAITSTPLLGLMAPGGAQTLTVRFAPPAGADAPLNDTLRIVSSDPDAPTLDIPLTGRRTNPVLQVLGSDLGSTWPVTLHDPIGEAVEKTVTLRNNGSGTLTVTSISLTDVTNGVFSIISKPNGTVTLGAGQSTALSVEFLPKGEGTHQATLRVETTERGVINTTLSGTGTACTASVTNAVSWRCMRNQLSMVECHPDWFDLDGDIQGMTGQAWGDPTGKSGCEYSCPAATRSPTDDPDDGFVDANCDGIDGYWDQTRTTAVFVSQDGLNTTARGTPDVPFRTIEYALSRIEAELKSVKHVYVAEGTYSGKVTLRNGVSIYGGYKRTSPYWERGAENVSIIENNSTTDSPLIAVQGTSITSPTTVSHMTIRTGNAGGIGRSNYAVHCASCSGLVLNRNDISSGAGSTGAAGTAGAAGASGGRGGDGSPGSCDGTWAPWGGHKGGPGGSGGTSSCSRAGGAGGAGGDEGANKGATGGTGQVGVAGGGGGNGGNPGKAGSNGTSGGGGGAGSNGSATSLAGGYLSGVYWIGYSSYGGSGGSPGNGGGGGGGGGGQGAWNVNNGPGNGGGGGGGGGCGGDGGEGGSAGGASFGVFLRSSTGAVLTNNVIVAGRGGTGGAGGAGGAGGSGGGGGTGASTCTSEVGRGGNGGSGGSGGGGGNGAGGPGGVSYGVYRSGTTISGSSTGNDVRTTGGGSGGLGGQRTGTTRAASGPTGSSAPWYP